MSVVRAPDDHRRCASLVRRETRASALGFARHEQRVREQDQLALIASDLAGRRVGVRCPGFLSSLVATRREAGRVAFDASGQPQNHTDLSPETCKA